MGALPSARRGDVDLAPRLTSALYRALLLVAVAVAAMRIYNRFDVALLLDDAYIFQRYAHRLLAGDLIAFNPGGEPTYGLTALLYLAPVTLAQLLAGGNPSLAAVGSSLLFGVVFVLLLGCLLSRVAALGLPARRFGLLLAAVCLAWSDTTESFTSGMDTTFALAYVAALLIVAVRFEARPSRRAALAVGGLGAVAFWVRPELCCFALAVPAAMAWRGSDATTRFLAWRALVVAVGGLLVVLALNQLLFGTALPLSFYAKSPGAYEGALDRVYQGVAVQHLFDFIGGWWPAFLVIALDVGIGLRHHGPRIPRLDRGLILAVTVHLVYHAFWALPVVGDGQRFFQPLVAPLLLLAARAVHRWEQALGPSLRRGAGPTLAAVAWLGSAWLGSLLVPVLVDEGKAFAVNATRRRGSWAPERHARSEHARGYWFMIDELGELSPAVTLATTEVGFLGALYPDRRIIDLAGLNDRRFARQGFDAERVLVELRPDLLYMPHEDYAPMVEALKMHPAFDGYEHYDKHRLGTRYFGLALRRDSAHYDAMRALVERERPQPLLRRRR